MASDHVSAWIDKGEVVDRYYNPGDLFDEIHLLLMNNDKPDLTQVQRMSGRAKIFIHNYPEPPHFFTKTLGWQPFLISEWAKGGVELIKSIGPSLIRCHGAHLNSFVAYLSKKELGFPYVVSLHINPDENYRKSASSFKEKVISFSLKKIEKIGLRNADLVLPVYEPILPYLKSLGVERYRVCYNVLNDKHLVPKKDYTLNNPVQIISIGRLVEQKNPENLISAMKFFVNVKLTFVGSGDYQERLKDHAKKEGVLDNITFVKAIKNDELCESLHKYDFMAIHTEHFEISKVMLECFLAGLPLMINYRKGAQVPELNDEICLRVENTVEGYREGISALMSSTEKRKSLGQNSYNEAQRRWSPKMCESAYVSVYKELRR